MIVPGDVNSTLAAALTAAKMQIPVAHIESGLRSFDRTMPEELNRIVTDQLAEYLFLHSPEAVENLRAEGIAAERMHFVGNTMIDTLVALEARFRAAAAASGLGLETGGYVLVTLHRPALVDGSLLAETVRRLAGLAARDAGRLPRSPAHAQDDGGGRRRASRPAAQRAPRLRRLPLAAGRRRGGPHRLGRHPGGDDLPRHPLLHPARQHRAPGDDPRRHQHPPRPRPGRDLADSGVAPRTAPR